MTKILKDWLAMITMLLELGNAERDNEKGAKKRQILTRFPKGHKEAGKLMHHDQARAFSLCLAEFADLNPKLTLQDFLQGMDCYDPKLSHEGILKDFGKAILPSRKIKAQSETKAQKDLKIQNLEALNIARSELLKAIIDSKTLTAKRKITAMMTATATTTGEQMTKLAKDLKLKFKA